MAVLSLSRDAMSANYKSPPESKEPLNLRVPRSLRAKIETLVRLWKAVGTAKRDDTENIDITFVTTTLLQLAVNADLDSFGGMPKDEEALRDLEASIARGDFVPKQKK